MSREWSRHSFKAVDAAQGSARVADDPVAAGPKSFAPQDPVTWRNADGFVRKGEGFEMAAGLKLKAKPSPAASKAGFVPSRAYGVPVPTGQDEPEPANDDIVEDAPVETPAADASAISDAFAAGFAEGARTAHATMSAEAASCARLIVALTGTSKFDRPGLAQRLQQTVLHLVRQMVGEVGISPERLAKRVDDAVTMLADATEPARVFLNPEDLALIGAHLPAHVSAVGNAQIERGGFRMETISATIEDMPTLWMEQLADALDRVSISE